MMKVVCAALLMGLSVTALAQSPDFVGLTVIASAQPPDEQQTPAQSPPQQQTNAQATNAAHANAQVSQQPAAKYTPFHRFELSGGWSHITGNEGLDGFNAGAFVYLDPRISIGFNYDGVYDTTILGAFALTNVGLTTTKSHLQNFMAGPRFYFPGLFKGHGNVRGHILHPFAQAQFGESELWSQVTAVNVGTVTSTDTAFSWLLGAGGDFDFKSRWSARISVDLLRTHIADAGQSRLRLIMGLACRF
jgi:hypothetical protein